MAKKPRRYKGRSTQGDKPRAAKATDLLIVATAAATERELYTLDSAQARLAEAAGVGTALL